MTAFAVMELQYVQLASFLWCLRSLSYVSALIGRLITEQASDASGMHQLPSACVSCLCLCLACNLAFWRSELPVSTSST